MRFPRPLQPGDVIGLTAPSAGVPEGLYPRLDAAVRRLEEQGFRVKEGACLRGDNPPAARAAAFTALWHDPDVAAIIPPWGGEFLIGILPLLDFRAFAAAPPKWVLGYSDISTLTFPLTLLAQTATAHGTCLMEMVRGQTDPLVRDCLVPLRLSPGTAHTQRSTKLFQTASTDWAHEPERGFELTEPTRWRVLGPDPDAAVTVTGRLLGGCLDTLQCLVGTRFADVAGFKARHRADGVVLYLENCELNPPSVYRALTQLRFAGWFDGLAGLVLGRSSVRGEPAAQAEALAGLPFPIIADADIGHVPPQFTLLNGAMARFESAGGRGSVTQQLLAGGG